MPSNTRCSYICACVLCIHNATREIIRRFSYTVVVIGGNDLTISPWRVHMKTKWRSYPSLKEIKYTSIHQPVLISLDITPSIHSNHRHSSQLYKADSFARYSAYTRQRHSARAVELPSPPQAPSQSWDAPKIGTRPTNDRRHRRHSCYSSTYLQKKDAYYCIHTPGMEIDATWRRDIVGILAFWPTMRILLVVDCPRSPC